MQLEHAKAMALAYMEQHGLLNRADSKNWRFMFDRAKQRFGRCSYRIRVITLSSHLVPAMTVDEVRDTILHEIAHALEWIRHRSAGHGPKWKSICVEIGARPVRCGKRVDTTKVQSPYLLKCSSSTCGRESPRYRKTQTTYLCGKCRNKMNLVHYETKTPVYQ